MTAHCIPALTRGTFICFSLTRVTMVPWSTLTCKAIHLVLCEICCKQVVELLEEKVIYHASATVEARGRGTIIMVRFTVHSDVARYTVTGISIYQVLQWSVKPQRNDITRTVDTYNTSCSISARVWLTVIDVDLTAVTLKPSGTLTSVSINKILKFIILFWNRVVCEVKFNLQCKCLGFDKGLVNTHWFHSGSLFPRSLEYRNRYTHHDHHWYK